MDGRKQPEMHFHYAVLQGYGPAYPARGFGPRGALLDARAAEGHSAPRSGAGAAALESNKMFSQLQSGACPFASCPMFVCRSRGSLCVHASEDPDVQHAKELLSSSAFDLNTEQQLNGRQEFTKEVVNLALTIALDYWNGLIRTQDVVSRDGWLTGEVLFDIPQDQVPPFLSIALCVISADGKYTVKCNFGVI